MSFPLLVKRKTVNVLFYSPSEDRSIRRIQGKENIRMLGLLKRSLTKSHDIVNGRTYHTVESFSFALRGTIKENSEYCLVILDNHGYDSSQSSGHLLRKDDPNLSKTYDFYHGKGYLPESSFGIVGRGSSDAKLEKKMVNIRRRNQKRRGQRRKKVKKKRIDDFENSNQWVGVKDLLKYSKSIRRKTKYIFVAPEDYGRHNFAIGLRKFIVKNGFSPKSTSYGVGYSETPVGVNNTFHSKFVEIDLQNAISYGYIAELLE